jgi:hypothetical protein
MMILGSEETVKGREKGDMAVVDEQSHALYTLN